MSWITNVFKRKYNPPVQDVDLFLEHMEVLDRLISLSRMRQALMDKLDAREIDVFIYEKVDAELKAESAELKRKHNL